MTERRFPFSRCSSAALRASPLVTVGALGGAAWVLWAAALLLGASLLAGITQFGRCLAARSELKPPRAYPVLLVCWITLLLFITGRMADALGLLA